MPEVPFATIAGKTFVRVERVEDAVLADTLVFEEQGGRKYILYHGQDCCESVRIDDICGDLADLVGTPILLAEEVSHSPKGGFSKDNPMLLSEVWDKESLAVAVDYELERGNDVSELLVLAERVSPTDVRHLGASYNDSRESETWTFYKVSTIKGSVTIRWFGESNGYYSESVDFMVVDP